jgi:hypothetical protein
VETEKADSLKVVEEIAEVVKMDDEDIRTGMTFALETARAQARLQAIFDMENAFTERMREKYKVKPETHQMADWITGFVKTKPE